nr:unnamed protein product [Digitaria exilis]
MTHTSPELPPSLIHSCVTQPSCWLPHASSVSAAAAARQSMPREFVPSPPEPPCSSTSSSAIAALQLDLLISCCHCRCPTSPVPHLPCAASSAFALCTACFAAARRPAAPYPRVLEGAPPWCRLPP